MKIVVTYSNGYQFELKTSAETCASDRAQFESLPNVEDIRVIPA